MRRERSFRAACETLEGRALLSAGGAGLAHAERAAAFTLNGRLYPAFLGRYSPAGQSLGSSFSASGSAGAMGAVTVAGKISPQFVAGTNFPNLSGATMTLTDAKGTTTLGIGSSTSSTYPFTVTQATGAFAGDVGSGGSVTFTMIHPAGHSAQYALVLKSNRA